VISVDTVAYSSLVHIVTQWSGSGGTEAYLVSVSYHNVSFTSLAKGLLLFQVFDFVK